MVLTFELRHEKVPLPMAKSAPPLVYEVYEDTETEESDNVPVVEISNRLLLLPYDCEMEMEVYEIESVPLATVNVSTVFPEIEIVGREVVALEILIALDPTAICDPSECRPSRS